MEVLCATVECEDWALADFRAVLGIDWADEDPSELTPAPALRPNKRVLAASISSLMKGPKIYFFNHRHALKSSTFVFVLQT